MSSIRHTVFQLLARCAVAYCAVSTAVAAEETPSSDSNAEPSALSEVVVTARRREENQQTVPITINTYSESALEQQDIREVGTLDKNVPALSTVSNGGRTNFAFIRGVPGVLTYFADAPATLQGQALFFDNANVQVLKGPQGTLFGLSTNGGAVVIEPKRPGFETDAYVQAATGNQGRAQFEAATNIPVNDRIAFRVGAAYDHLDGYIQDVQSGREFGSENYWLVRLSSLIKITDSLDNYTIGNYFRSNGVPVTPVPEYVNPNGPGGPAVVAQLTAILAQQKALGWYKITGSSAPATSLFEQFNGSNITTWTLNDMLSVRNIIGFNSSRVQDTAEFDGTALRVLDTGVPPSQPTDAAQQTTEELQLQGKLFDRLTYTAGTFHSWTGDGNGPLSYTDLRDAFGILSVAAPRNRGQTHAFFGEGTFDLSSWASGLSITAGVRHTKDERSIHQESGIAFSPAAAPIITTNLQQSAGWAATSWRAGLNYQLDPRSLLYVMISKGYSSGGFNATAAQQFRVFNPESLLNYEAGIKSEWSIGDLQARTNFSAYYGKYSDIQVPTTSRVCDAQGNCTLAVVTQNAAEGKIKGAEAELTIVPVRSVELTVNGSYMDTSYTKYPSFDSAGNPIDLSSTPFVYVPKWKLNAHPVVHLPVPQAVGEVSLAADYSWQSYYFNSADPARAFYDINPSFSNLDLSLNVKDLLQHPGLSVSLFGLNVAQNHWAQNQLAAYTQLGLFSAGVARSRQYGIRVRYDIQ